eukprot:752288-Hanusia_phi.AAC.7
MQEIRAFEFWESIYIFYRWKEIENGIEAGARSWEKERGGEDRFCAAEQPYKRWLRNEKEDGGG